MKKIFLFMLILCLEIKISAQQPNEYKPAMSSVIPPSPNAASLGQYGNVPISYYNGTTNINIPLHDIELAGQKLPISIGYNSSGIKVTQEASWVGLSWALNAGGCITRECFGGDDFKESTSFGYYWDNNLTLDLLTNPQYTPIGTWRPEILWLLNTDPQPDIFHFNFGQYSGSMFFEKGNPVPLIRNCKEYLKPLYNPEHKYWQIKDGNGYIYYFGRSEASRDISTGCYKSDRAEYNITPLNPVRTINDISELITQYPFESVITAWYLDSIVAPNHDKITFEYNSENISVVPKSEEDVRTILISGPVGSEIIPRLDQFTYTGSKIKQTFLSKIKYTNGEITFITSDRKDIKSENTNGRKAQKLEKIIIKNSQEELKEFVFDYIYLGDENEPRTCRLLLNKLIEQSTDTNGLNRQHLFNYNMGYLPPKNSRQIDFWGFYNHSKAPEIWGDTKGNETEEGTLIASFIKPADQLGAQTFFYGRDRTPKVEYMQSGILQKIIYPTGGSTQFIYEPHEFANTFNICFDQTALLNLSLILKENPYNQFSLYETEQSIGEFEINKTYNIKINSSISSIFPVTFPVEPYQHAGNLYLGKYDPDLNQYNYSYYSIPCLKQMVAPTNELEIQLSPGKYRAYIEPLTSLTNVTASPLEHIEMYPNYYTFKSEISFVEEKTTSCGSGLRIKEIYDITGQQQTSYRKFNYKKNNTSTGQLFTIPLFNTQYAFEQMNSPKPGHCFGFDPEIYTSTYFWARSTPFVPLIRTFSSFPVGYSEVEEVFSENGNQGKKIYSFHNTEQINITYNDLYVPDKVYLNSGFNGLPDNIRTFDKHGYKLEMKQFYYLQDLSERYSRGFCATQIFPDFELAKQQWREICDRLILINPSIPNVRIGQYDISSEWLKLSNEITTTYFNQEQDSVVQSTAYSYNNINFRPTVESTIDSRGDTFESRITYPTSLTDPLFLKSLLNNPIEKSRYKNENLLEQQRITYSDKYNSGQLLPEYFYYKLGNSPEEKRIEFHHYDSKGNNLYVTKDDSIKVCYLWGYNYEYPIAEIRNATYNQVINSVNPSSLANITESSNYPSDEMINTLSTSLRSNLPLAEVTTYTYKPLVGMTSQTDPRGVTTYYEYDGFGRLKEVYIIENGVKKILKYHNYHYSNNLE